MPNTPVPAPTNAELDDAFWDDLVTRISEGEVIPVVGPGAVTFGRENELLYPWLTQRLAAELNLPFESPPRDLQEIVDAQRAADARSANPKIDRINRIYKHLRDIVEDPDLRPGATLAALAAIEGFRLFISTTFDPLLSRAVSSVSPGGKPEECLAASSLRNACPDIPQQLGALERRFVYQILGRAQPYRDFAVWDDDVFRFLLRLDQQIPLLPNLLDALQNSHLLVLGLRFDHWLLRFFVQVVKRQPLSEIAGTELFVFEKLEASEREKVVVYFGRLTKLIHVFPSDPIEFISQLYRHWRQKHPAPPDDPHLMKKAHREKHRSPGCIFVSYASPDLETARYVVSQLQNAGCLVWFDKEQIQPGEDWEEVLREGVEKRCGLFLSLISNTTAQRLEGYNILERNLAAKRRERLAENAIFYLPIRIDDGEPLIPANEPRGTGKIQGVRKLNGHLDADFIGYLREKQRENCAALGYPAPPETP